jgi:hypothetical protein
MPVVVQNPDNWMVVLMRLSGPASFNMSAGLSGQGNGVLENSTSTAPCPVTRSSST